MEGDNLRDADCRLVFIYCQQIKSHRFIYWQSIYLAILAENIIEEQEDAQNIERKIQILELTHHHFDQYIAQDSEADAIGNAVAEHHRNHRDEGWE